MRTRLQAPLTAVLPTLLIFASCGPGATECDAGEVEPPAPIAAGGWKGTYECNNNIQKMSAALAMSDDGQLDGEAFLDYEIMILAQPFTLTGRSNVDEGRFEGEQLVARIDVLDNSQGFPDWNVRLSLEGNGDELNGELYRLNGNGDEITCGVELERVVVTDPPYEPDAPADGG
jgi:hypothetical protein